MFTKLEVKVSSVKIKAILYMKMIATMARLCDQIFASHPYLFCSSWPLSDLFSSFIWILVWIFIYWLVGSQICTYVISLSLSPVSFVVFIFSLPLPHPSLCCWGPKDATWECFGLWHIMYLSLTKLTG